MAGASVGTAPHNDATELDVLSAVRADLGALIDESRRWSPSVRLAGAPGDLARSPAPASRPTASRAPDAAATTRAPRSSGPVLATDPAGLIDAIGEIESLKNTLDALQARYEVALRDARIQSHREAGLLRDKQGSGVSDEIALARGMSPSRAGNQLALRRVVVETLPRTWSRMAEGAVSSWAAEEVARAVIVLKDEDRAQVDAELAPGLHELSPTVAGRRARARADVLDQEAAVARIRRNISQRHVSQRPAAEGMLRLSALLPLHEGVAAFASLSAAADTARSRGDERSRGQVMADALTARVTGQEDAAAPVEIHLLMTDRTLLADDTDTAELEGHPIPGPVARHLALTGDLVPQSPSPAPAPESETGPAPSPPPEPVKRWIRRLYADPVSGALQEMDGRRRLFTGEARRFVLARDRRCRTPWCEARARVVDHVDGYAGGGHTTAENGAGVCERFNYVKELPGWVTTVEPDSGTLTISTPTGHVHRSPVPSHWDAVGIQPGSTTDPPGKWKGT